MSGPDVFALVADHRRRAVALFEGLDAAQWAAPSLCAGWTVRDVAGHLVVPFEVSAPSLLLEVVRQRGSFDRAMDRVSRRVAQRPTAELIEVLRAHTGSRFTPPGQGPEAPLADLSIHLHDVARPLGLDLTLPPTSWRLVLDYFMSTRSRRAFVPAARLAGLSFTTTDQRWSAGAGQEVRGTSAAVALALAGRTAVLDELDGRGLDRLRARLS